MFLKVSEIAEQLGAHVIDARFFGTHSVRKGSATFVTSASNETQDRYIKREAASDAFVGRTAAGLPLDEESFSILPPHFKETSIKIRLM